MSWDLTRYTEGALYEHVRKVTQQSLTNYADTIDAILTRQEREGDGYLDSAGDPGVATRESFLFQEEPGRINLLGARGFHPEELGPVAPHERRWDDTMFVVYRDAEGRGRARHYKLNTERNSPGAQSHLLEGFHRYQFGYHREATRLALEPYPRVKSRTCSGGYPSPPPAQLDVENGSISWNQNINIHNGGTDSTPVGWSDGCQTMWGAHPANGGEGFPDFIHLCKSDTSVMGAGGSRVLSYPLVRGEELAPRGATRWQAPREPLSLGQLETHYANNEGGVGGFYPVGWNRVWHGGVHLHGAGEVFAVADGEVVAARLHSGADPTPVDGGQTSRCFVLIRHQLELSRGAGESYQPYVWSLYYHLEPLDGATSGGPDEPDWVGLLATLDPAALERLHAGEVVEPGVFVGCGEMIGQSGLLGGARALHFEVMSEEPLDLEVFQRAPFEHFTSDRDGDGFADDEDLLRRLDRREEPAGDSASDWPAWPWGSESDEEDEQGLPVIDEEEARAAAREARNFVVQHQSEWSAVDWSALREAPWELNEEEYQAALEEIERLQFHRGLGAKAPQTSRITSYHPLRFLEAIQDQVDAQNVFGDECLPLPSEEQPSGSGRPLLWIGAQSEWVETLQRELNRLGHELVPDGIFGGQTDAAVRDFQTASGCTVDGVVGDQTWGALDAQGAAI